MNKKKRYTPFFSDNKNKKLTEAFLKGSMEKVIRLTCKVLSKRIGKKINADFLAPFEFQNSEGKFAGVVCLIGTSAIRFNWKLTDMSGEIVSVSVWVKPTRQPTFQIDTNGLNIVKMIDVIAAALQQKKVGVFQLEESAEGIRGKRLAEADNPVITNAIKQWAIDRDISDDDLVNKRISHLFKDYEYWQKEVAQGKYPSMTNITFRAYIIQFLNKNGLKNIFMRTIVVKDAGKEKMIVTDDASASAYKDIQHLQMTMGDKLEFMKQNIVAVARGYSNATIICGRAGIGKTTFTNQILKDENMKIFNMNGAIRNMKILYNLFYQNNSPDSVIVFDDVEDVFKPAYMPLINAALDDKKERILSFPLEIGKEIKKFQPQLVYTGKVIILTNRDKAKLPKAMFSRTVPIEITASNFEVVDEIRRNLENVMPEVNGVKIPIEAKETVLNFIESLGKNIQQIDFRIFQRCMVFYLTGDQSWKKWVYAMVAKAA